MLTNDYNIAFQFSFSTILVFVIFLTVFVYRRATRNHDFWLKNGIPGPKPIPFFGNALSAFFSDPAHSTNERYRKYGPVYGFYQNNIPVLSVGIPSLIKKIMVKDFHIFTNRPVIEFESNPIMRLTLSCARNERWKILRSIITQSLSIGKIKKMQPLINECIKIVIDDLSERNNSEIDLNEIFSLFTKNVSCSCFFSIKPDHQSELSKSTQSLIKRLSLLLHPTFFQYLLLFTLPSGLFKFLGISFIDKQSINYFKQLIEMILKEQSSAESNTFVRTFIENVEKIKTDQNAKILITDEDVVAQLLIILLGAFETTKIALSLTVFHLALYSDVQEKLFKEVYKHQQKYGDFDFDKCNRDELPYLHAVIDEVLRLHQINVILLRECSEDYCFEELNGLVIPKGTYIQVPLSAMARDDKYFEDADKFKPERFLPENVDKIQRNVYMPFGIGPRICVGMNLALIEIKALVYHLVLNFKFERSVNSPDSVEYIRVPFSFLLAVKNLYVKVITR